MADESSWDGGGARRGRGGRAQSSSYSSASTSGRRAPGSPAMDSTKEWHKSHRRTGKGFSRKSESRFWRNSYLIHLQAVIRHVFHRFLPIIDVIRCRSMPVYERIKHRLRPIPDSFWLRIQGFVGRSAFIIGALLGCGIRGTTSIFLLGPGAWCIVFWSNLFNLYVLAGFLSLFIAAVATAGVSFFLGLIPGFVIVGLYGSVNLWMYGSFWTTLVIILFAVVLLLFGKWRPIGGYILLLYSVYSCKANGGWLGLLMCIGLTCISSDLILHLTANFEAQKYRAAHKQYAQKNKVRHTEATLNTEDAAVGGTEVDQTAAEEEIARVLKSNNHYDVLGLTRFEQFEEAVIRKEYRKKAMLVHPDKNRGNAKAEEAFKQLQNAYEVLSNTEKRNNYDEDLRKEELLMNFRRSAVGLHKNGRCESPECACHSNTQEDEEGELFEARPIVCTNCKQLHLWSRTDRDIQHARWCQECQQFHPAKDGDGWVEQSGHSVFFGMIHKVDAPQAYVCAESIVYNVTEWAICQGMKCPANTHRPSFSVGTTTAGGARKSKRADGYPFPGEFTSEEEFFEWLEQAVASGVFNDDQQNQQGSGSSQGKTPKRKKKRGGNKKQW